MNGAVLFGALIGGVIVGLIPAVCGAVKGKIGLAIGGFFACVVASFILGMILSLPVCAIFLFLILKKPPNTAVPGQPAVMPGLQPENTAAQLQKLEDLKNAGVLSEEEFQAKRRQVTQKK